MRLLGMPWGSSPMQPEAWAPVGLKYRSSTAFQVCGQVNEGGGDRLCPSSVQRPLPPRSLSHSLSLGRSRGPALPGAVTLRSHRRLPSSSVLLGGRCLESHL